MFEDTKIEEMNNSEEKGLETVLSFIKSFSFPSIYGKGISVPYSQCCIKR